MISIILFRLPVYTCTLDKKSPGGQIKIFSLIFIDEYGHQRYLLNGLSFFYMFTNQWYLLSTHFVCVRSNLLHLLQKNYNFSAATSIKNGVLGNWCSTTKFEVWVKYLEKVNNFGYHGTWEKLSTNLPEFELAFQIGPFWCIHPTLSPSWKIWFVNIEK